MYPIPENPKTFREWLWENNITQAEAAKDLNIPQQMVSRFLKKVTPTVEMIEVIENYTKGAVTYHAFRLSAKKAGDERLVRKGYSSRSILKQWQTL